MRGRASATVDYDTERRGNMTRRTRTTETRDMQHMARHGPLARGKMLTATSAGILALALLTGCQAGPLTTDGPPEAPDGSAQPPAGEDATDSPEATVNEPTEPTETSPAAPDGLPSDLPDLGIPFYMPSELASIMSVGGPWVIEFVTDDSINSVRDYITDRVSAAHGWADAITEATETYIARQGTKDGYKLTIVMNNERDPDRLSLFYTIDHE